MRYTLRGRLSGQIGTDCVEPLANAAVRLYRLQANQDATRLAVADPKATFAVLSADQVSAKDSSLLGEFPTDASGAFTAVLDDAHYAGGPFEIDVRFTTVPGRPQQPLPKGPLQFSITTIQPQWRERPDGLVAAWEYVLPNRFWCNIRGRLDAWVICGTVTVISTGLPAAGVKVIAFDRDWLQDDPLGSAFTDVNGHFWIDYVGADFRHGTWINIELFGGPDVYFHIESPSGTPLLTESPDQGRTPGRENVGPCFCVNLSIRKAPVVRYAWFTRVGDFNIYSDIDPATGLTLSAQPFGSPTPHGGPGFGFWGSLKLVGDCPTTHPWGGGQPMRYRFRVGPAGGTANPITGAAMVTTVKVGTRPVSWNFGFGVQIYPQDIYVAGAGGYVGPMPAPAPTPPSGPPLGTWGPMPPLVLQPDAQGWVTMPPDATNQGFSGPLLRLNSSSVAPGGWPPTVGAGNAVSGASQKSGSDFEIIYEAEPVTGPAPGAPTLSNSLSRIHIDNWLEDAEISVDEFTAPGATPCSGITTAVDLRYTMDHELVADWALTLSTSAPAPAGGYPTLPGMTVAPVPPDEHSSARGGYGIAHIDTSAWAKCAYGIVFSRRLKLTDGETDDSGRGPMVLIFCKT